ncbi:synaptotagmin-2-like [Oscarella lobularis]|uniref:synaptotagmin-2-like n=1 Tax=Oscarella lobularis TaxID=121494 RepID=UPI0033142352
MYVVLLGLLCGIAAAVIILLVVCLCHRCGLLDSCIRSTKPDSDYPIIGFPSPDALSGRTEYVQPSFTDDGDLDPRPGRRAPPPVAAAEIPGSAVDAAVLRERLARLAYDSGDESPMPLGQLDFSVGYDSDAMALAGVVMGATQLPIVRGRAPTTFVHVTLLPGQHYRYKTSTKREETNPRFDEAFRFGVVDLDELIGSGLLQFRLYHSDWLRKEELIGWYDVNLGDYGKARLCSGVRESCPLNSPAILRKVSSLSSQSSYSETPLSGGSAPHSARIVGETPEMLRRQLGFVSIEKSIDSHHHSDGTLSESDLSEGHFQASPKRSSQRRSRKISARMGGGMIQLSISYSEENARLLVIVLKAKDLPMRKGGQAPDVFARLHLYSNLDRRKHSKKSTSVKKTNPDPVFNESFSLHCATSDLDHVTLVVSVMDRDSSGESVLLGRVNLGVEASGEREARHWLDVVSQETAGRNITAWHALKK